MGNELDTKSIRDQINRIKPFIYYYVVMVIFAFIGGMFFFYGYYHDKVVLYTAIAGIWLVAGVAIYTIGYILKMYKRIIESLLDEVGNNRSS